MDKTLLTLIAKINSKDLFNTSVIDWATPVPSFGNVSQCKVATLGLNPSNREFVDSSGFELKGLDRRFHTLESLGIDDWSYIRKSHLKLITSSCNNYFFNNPYDGWFRSLDVIVSGTGSSYYNAVDPACHLDLVPYATSCKWGEMNPVERRSILTCSGDSLASLLCESSVNTLILNGASVVDLFQSISSIVLEKREMPSWTLPRKSGSGVKGFSYYGELNNLLGFGFSNRIVVLGYNHNIQSSFGVTNTVKQSISKWIKKRVIGSRYEK